jgi:homoserine O-acetyltransferase
MPSLETRIPDEVLPPTRLDFAVELQSLPEASRAHLPNWTRASLIGAAEAPLLVALGGISADCNPAYGKDGHAGWWHSLFGAGAPLGIDRYRVLGIDFIADREGGYAPDTFEQASILADTLDAIGEEPLAIVGASYGGMVALAYAERFAARTRLVVISASAAPHPMATAARGLQRAVVKLGLEKGCEQEALKIARGMAMLTYRSATEFKERFKGGISGPEPCAESEPLSYLKARGEAFAKVMEPGRYLSLSGSIDRHSVKPDAIEAPALLIGVEDDRLIPLEDMARLARELRGPADFRAIRSVYGHDAFLKEPKRLGELIRPFLEEPVGGPEERSREA